MADTTSAGAPAATEPAELSFEDAIGRMDDEDTLAPETGAAEGDENEENPVVKVEEDEAAPQAEGPEDTAEVDLGDGKKATIADLKQAYASFEESKTETTRVLQETATERGNLRTLGTNMAQALENISNYLVQRLPPEPDPDLAYSDPAEHYRATVRRNNAVAELQDMLAVKEGAQQAAGLLSEADFKAAKAAEDQKWIAAVPTLKDPKRFSAAEGKVKTHAKALGFTDQEIDTTADHRLRKVFFQSARYEEIMANAGKAKGKVENASVMPPPKARQHANSQQALAQVNAKRALQKSGSFEDAMKAWNP